MSFSSSWWVKNSAGSADSIGERGFDVLAGVKSAKDGDRIEGGKAQFGLAVVVDRREPDDLDVELAPFGFQALQLFSAIAPQAEFERVADDRLLDCVRMGG